MEALMFVVGLFAGMGASDLYGRLTLPDATLFSAAGLTLAVSDLIVIGAGVYIGFYDGKHKMLGYGIIAGAVLTMLMQSFGK